MAIKNANINSFKSTNTRNTSNIQRFFASNKQNVVRNITRSFIHQKLISKFSNPTLNKTENLTEVLAHIIPSFQSNTRKHQDQNRNNKKASLKFVKRVYTFLCVN